jgi:hypothetical protein
VAIVAFLASAIWQRQVAETQRDEALKQTRVSRSRELAALATNQLAIDPVDSVRLARDDAREALSSQAGEALRRALFASHVRLGDPGRCAGAR